MHINDIVAVIGLKNRTTELLETLCRSIGIPVHYAMKKSDPTQRIEGVEDEAVVTPALDHLAPNVFILGLLASNQLCDGGIIDCNWEEEREAIGYALGWFVYRHRWDSDMPTGWKLLDTCSDRLTKDYDPRLRSYHVGSVLSDGRIVIERRGENRLVQLPDEYRDWFPVMTGFQV